MTPVVALAGCLAVAAGAENIVARDLASASPAFAAIAGDTQVAMAPAPGIRRVFSIPELRRLAVRLHLPFAPDATICVERPTHAPDPAQLLAAMRKELPAARIEILDYSRHPIPEGEIEFPARGLQRGGAGAFWMGSVRYGRNRRFTIWARVKARVLVNRAVAAVEMRSGQAITADQVTVLTRDEPPALGGFAESLEQVVGKWARVPIQAASAIRLDQLEAPREVVRGETVKVDVREGAVRMELEAVAEASGAHGDVIPVRNMASKKRFMARVAGAGRVLVDGSMAKVMR